MATPLRYGFLGAGRMAHIHAAHLKTVDPDGRIVAVFSRTEEHAAASAAEWGALRHYTDYRALLDSEDLDAVFVCTPTFIHAEIALAAAERDLHLFVEKPLDLDLALGAQLADEVERRGLVNLAAFHWRYTDLYRRAKDLMGDDPVAMVNLRWYWTRPPIRWMWDRAMAGGQMVDQSIHLIDLSRGLVGEIESVYAAYNERQVNFEDEFNNWDGYALTLRYAGGAVGNCAGTYGLFEAIQVGPAADFALRDRLLRMTIDGLTLYTPDGMQSWHHKHPFHLGVTREFVHAIKSGDTSRIATDIRAGLHTTAAVLAANESARSGVPVNPMEFLAGEIAHD